MWYLSFRLILTFAAGEWSTLMLPTHTALPLVDMAGPLALQRNFSVLGFSCDNWLNHSFTITILPVQLKNTKAGDPSLIIDDFKGTRSLWEQTASHASSNSSYTQQAEVRVVHEDESPSGMALQLICGHNNGSCGAASAGGKCPEGCLYDGSWCQRLQTSYVNRKPSQEFCLPTECNSTNTLDVREYEAFDLTWKASDEFRHLPIRLYDFPIGMQTTRYPSFSNKT